MNDALNSEDSRHVRTTFLASLAVVLGLVLSSFAWAGVNAPAAGARASALPAAASAAPGSFSAAEETSNETLGCGCAEACLVAN